MYGSLEFCVKMFFVIICTLFFSKTLSGEYLYPVASFQRCGQELVYLFYQKSLQHAELWLWNPGTLEAQKALLSSYTPGGLRMIPDNTGFSFNDNGRIRIKEFMKRSPRSIDIYEPIYDIGVIEWIDGDHAYFTAKYKDTSMIFTLHRKNELLVCLVNSEPAECLYPCIVHNELFYIERLRVASDSERSCAGCTYRIMGALLSASSINAVVVNNEVGKAVISEEEKKVIVNFDSQPIAFLHMQDTNNGYVLAHSPQIPKESTELLIDYYEIAKQDAQWSKRLLFSFSIPTFLLLPESPLCLYESLFPLLPKKIGSYIYFGSFENQRVNLFRYDCSSQTIECVKKATSIDESIFVPWRIKGALYAGGTVQNDAAPRFYFGSQEEMCCELNELLPERVSTIL